jgi:hypothetical protein
LTSPLNLLILATVALAIASFVCAVIAYVKMMATISPGVSRIHAARLGIKENLLFLSCPELFVGPGVRYRRWYIASALTFAGSLVVAAGAGSLRQP